MKNKTFILTLLFSLLCVINAFAETTIKAGVDKVNITTDEVVSYKLTIAATQKNIPKPELPQFDAFRVVSQVQSSNVSLSKKDIKTTIAHTYILAPIQAGSFKIEPTKITIDNQTFSSDAFEIEVKQGKVKPQKIQPETEQPQITL